MQIAKKGCFRMCGVLARYLTCLLAICITSASSLSATFRHVRVLSSHMSTNYFLEPSQPQLWSHSSMHEAYSHLQTCSVAVHTPNCKGKAINSISFNLVIQIPKIFGPFDALIWTFHGLFDSHTQTHTDRQTDTHPISIIVSPFVPYSQSQKYEKRVKQHHHQSRI